MELRKVLEEQLLVLLVCKVLRIQRIQISTCLVDLITVCRVKLVQSTMVSLLEAAIETRSSHRAPDDSSVRTSFFAEATTDKNSENLIIVLKVLYPANFSTCIYRFKTQISCVNKTLCKTSDT